ncbi:GntR family transcriptional regulator [Streptomyces sp. NPDC004684]
MTATAVDVQDRGIKRKPIPDEVASYVRELIISGEVRAGEFLRIDLIAAAIGVSNTPVREGLLTLRSEGFVQLVPRRGFVVVPFTREDLHDLFWTQAQLAGELAARAAVRITAEAVAELESILAAHIRAVEAGDRERITDLGHAFHRRINCAAGSHRLTLLLDTVVPRVPRRFRGAAEGCGGAVLDEHPLLLDALRRHQAHRARTLMERHIDAGAGQVLDALERQGRWSGLEPAS